VVVTSPAGRTVTVRATSFVLACGTVENTRLAWMLTGSLPGVRANRAIGVGVMDRPRLAGTLHLDDDPADWLAEFGMHDADGVPTLTRWLLPADAVRAGTPSCAFLVAPTGGGSARRRLERAAKQMLVTSPTVFEQRVADHVGPWTARRLVGTNQRTYGIRSWAYRRVLRADWDLEWSAWPEATRVWRRQRTWSVTAIIEQFPHPANRLELADARDVHGRPVPRLVWGRPIERAGVVGRALTRATQAFEKAGIGRLDWQPEGFTSVSSCHLMGSLPIGDDPSHSATDPTGRLRGSANVFVAGSCLFPTGGHSNPTLTAMALAIGTADSIAGPRPTQTDLSAHQVRTRRRDPVEVTASARR
jgi:choline dehydrogenase-like flavoprotein